MDRRLGIDVGNDRKSSSSYRIFAGISRRTIFSKTVMDRGYGLRVPPGRVVSYLGPVNVTGCAAFPIGAEKGNNLFAQKRLAVTRPIFRARSSFTQSSRRKARNKLARVARSCCTALFRSSRMQIVAISGFFCQLEKRDARGGRPGSKWLAIPRTDHLEHRGHRVREAWRGENIAGYLYRRFATLAATCSRQPPLRDSRLCRADTSRRVSQPASKAETSAVELHQRHLVGGAITFSLR